MRVAARWVCLVAVLLVQRNGVRAFSMGAPDSICDNLLPGHGASSQTSPSPFNVIVAPIDDASGRRLVNVTISGQEGLNFAGFVIQARPESGGNALGSFEVQPDLGKTYTCGRGLKV
jgi:Reeler domain